MRIRLDERLIHGQILAGIVKFSKIRHIIVVSKSVRNDSLRKELMTLSLPKDIELVFFDCPQMLKEYPAFGEEYLVLFEKISELFDFLQKSQYKKEVSLANYHSPDGTIKLKKTLTLTDDEYNMLRKFSDTGFNFVYMLIPYKREKLW